MEWNILLDSLGGIRPTHAKLARAGVKSISRTRKAHCRDCGRYTRCSRMQEVADQDSIWGRDQQQQHSYFQDVDYYLLPLV